MNETTVIGGPFDGTLLHESAIPAQMVIHITIMERIPDPAKADQHAELHRGLYAYRPETRTLIYTRLKS